jgi:hypothetical protein
MLRIHDSGYRGENLVSNWLVDGAKIKERNAPENGGTGHDEPLAPRARRTFIVTFELFASCGRNVPGKLQNSN